MKRFGNGNTTITKIKKSPDFSGLFYVIKREKLFFLFLFHFSF